MDAPCSKPPDCRQQVMRHLYETMVKGFDVDEGRSPGRFGPKDCFGSTNV